MEPIEFIDILLNEWRDELARTEKNVPRQVVFPVADRKIKVAVGMRRTGKTACLFQQMRTLLAKGISPTRIFYINFEDDRLMPLTREKGAAWIDAFYTRYPENHDHRCYLFLDEIQLVPDWAVIVRRMHDTKDAEIYLSGSSAKLLSKEIHTSLRGRSLSTEIWPLSFSEFLNARDISVDTTLASKKAMDHLKKYFLEYMECGGFPEIVFFDTETRIKTLQEYIDVVIYRDIVERFEIKNIALLKYMIIFLLQNSAALFSVNKFYNDVKSQGYQTSKDTLHDYLHFIEDAFLSFNVTLYDRSIRKTNTNPKKIYAIDPGIMNAVILRKQRDFGKLFENIIYLELRRKEYKVNYYLTKDRHEVDFLAQSLTGDQKLIQVCWNVDDPATRKREERALLAAEKELGIEGELITLEKLLRKDFFHH